MILYTVMPQELMFPIETAQYEKQKVIESNGVPFLVNENSEKQYEIIRLLSTNPQDYLNAEYCPGQILRPFM